MQTQTRATQKPPYGLSFSVEELVLVRDWVGQRGLGFTILLDQVLDDAEFEEMVVVLTADGSSRVLTLWHTGASVFVQAPQSRPRAFPSVTQALDSAAPKAVRRVAWRRLF